MRSLLLPILAAAALSAGAASLPIGTPLVTEGDITVDAGDFDAAMLRVPEDKRAEFRTSHERVASIVDNLFLARSIAERARKEGLAQDPVVRRRMRQVQDNLLADLYLQEIDKSIAKLDLDARARELYEADKSHYMKPESVHVQQILVDLKGRTREMALERARKVYDEARSGKEDFLDLAARYSDDPSKISNGGDLRWREPKSFSAPVARQLAAMKKGEIAPPVESEDGFHILRLVARKPAEPLAFEDVKEAIVAQERERLAKKRREDLVREIRSSPTVTVHNKNVEALVIPVAGVLEGATKAPAAQATK